MLLKALSGSSCSENREFLSYCGFSNVQQIYFISTFPGLVLSKKTHSLKTVSIFFSANAQEI